MKKRDKSYITLSAGSQTSRHIYHDRDSLQYSAAYPLIELKDDPIKITDDPKKLEKYLLQNFWYQKSNSLKRKKILDRVIHLNKHLKIVLDFIDEKYGSLGFDCIHISTAGSYIYSDSPGDIDLDVIVNGSFFDYTTFNEGIELIDIVGTVKKISLTVMGEDNILGKQKVIDNIENEGFVNQDTIVRELLVAPMRNVTIYGKPFDNKKNIDGRNVLVRVARQLYFASLTMEGKIPYYEKEPLKTKKALNRINEAHEIIEWLLNTDYIINKD